MVSFFYAIIGGRRKKMHIPVFSIICMAVSALLSIGLPVALFVIIRKKYGAKFLPMIVGTASFCISVLVLEALVHRFVFGYTAIRDFPFLFIIYGIFMAGIFEETARFACFHIIKKKFQGIETGLSYGIGHGGIEAILLAGLSMINAIIVAIIINTGNVESITSGLEGIQLETTTELIKTLVTTAPLLFLVSGAERVMAICVQLCLSVIVYYSVFKKGCLRLFPIAILLHALVDVSAAAYQAGVLQSLLLVEGIVFITAAALVFLTVKVHLVCSKAEDKYGTKELTVE